MPRCNQTLLEPGPPLKLKVTGRCASPFFVFKVYAVKKKLAVALSGFCALPSFVSFASYVGV